MKTKWTILIISIIVIIGIICFVIFAKSGWRIRVYNAGDGSPDIEILSTGAVQFNMGQNGEFEFVPAWKISGTEIIIMDKINFNDKFYNPGDRLVTSENGEIIKEDFFPRVINDIRYFSYKLKHKNTYQQKEIYIRAENVTLRSSPMNEPDRLSLKFSTKVTSIEEQDDWIKVKSEQPKARGWLHQAVITESGEQIRMLNEQKIIPKLIMMISKNENGSIQGKPLAGSVTINLKNEFVLSPLDCIFFEKSNVSSMPKPFILSGDYKIDEPLPNKIYVINESGIFKSLDLNTFK